MHQIYGFAISTFETPAFLCRNSPDQAYSKCNRELICDKQNQNPLFQFEPDKEDAEYFDNWYLNMNLTCKDKSQYSIIGSSYFIGYFMGSIFFFLPDMFGRKGTFNRVMPIYILSCYFSLFSNSIELKILGFFMQGFFHIKTSLSYQHIYELVPKNKKVLCSTFLSSLDCATILSICFSLKYFTKSLDEVFHYIFYIQTTGIIIFFIIIPESPYWQFYTYGNKSYKAIDTLNYIAWFNRSKYRISYESEFNNAEGTIDDSSSLEN